MDWVMSVGLSGDVVMTAIDGPTPQIGDGIG